MVISYTKANAPWPVSKNHWQASTMMSPTGKHVPMTIWRSMIHAGESRVERTWSRRLRKSMLLTKWDLSSQLILHIPSVWEVPTAEIRVHQPHMYRQGSPNFTECELILKCHKNWSSGLKNGRCYSILRNVNASRHAGHGNTGVNYERGGTILYYYYYYIKL